MFVQLENDKIVGIFNQPQEHLEGFAGIDDNDKRIRPFKDEMIKLMEGDNVSNS